MIVSALILLAVVTAIDSAQLLPAGWSVVNPTTQKNAGLGFSFLYARWSGIHFIKWPDVGIAYGGVANFDLAGATYSGNHLRIPFTTSYLGDPVCSFELESKIYDFFYTLNSKQDAVHIYAFQWSQGQTYGVQDNFDNKNWSDISKYFTVTCLGATPPQV